MLEHEALTKRIIGAAIEVHRELGAGLLESAYEACMARELELVGLRVERQVLLPLEFKGVRIDAGYRLDMLVEGEVVLELKCIEKILPIHESQLITYLKLARKNVGLILNFNVEVMRNGIVRRVLSHPQSASAFSAPPR